MNKKFIKLNIAEGDIVRITTPEAMGVIGIVEKIDVENDGIILKEISEAELITQIENAMEYDKALFALTDIKYIFKLNLTKKPIKKHGTNDS